MRIKLIEHKYKKSILAILFCLFLIILFVICYRYIFKEQLQHRLKETIFTKIIKHEENLSGVVAEFNDDSKNIISVKKSNKDGSVIPYKKLNNDKITWAFDEFDLSFIGKYKIHKSDKSVVFYIYSPETYILWDEYEYGFYYSQNDKALNIIDISGECETEFEGFDMIFCRRYWYKTERITENWWFYESRTLD